MNLDHQYLYGLRQGNLDFWIKPGTSLSTLSKSNTTSRRWISFIESREQKEGKEIKEPKDGKEKENTAVRDGKDTQTTTTRITWSGAKCSEKSPSGSTTSSF